MQCPTCGCTVFSCLLDLADTDCAEQTLTADDFVTCRHCDSEWQLGDIAPDSEDDRA